MPKKLAGGPAPDLEDAFDVSFAKAVLSPVLFTLFLDDHVFVDDCINAGSFSFLAGR